MPRAGDPYLTGGALPLTHNPLVRINSNPPKTNAFDVEAFIEQWKTFIETYLFDIIEDLTGIDLTALKPLLDQFFATVNLVEDVLSALTSGDPAQWLGLITNLRGNLTGLFAGVDLFTGALDPAQVWSTIIGAILSPLGLLLTGSSPLNAGNIFGLLPFDVMGGQMSLSNVFDFLPELIVDPLLQFAETILGGDDFGLDTLVTHTFGGKTSNSIKVIPDGFIKELYGNTIRVGEGQDVTGRIFAKWTGLVGSGSPIKLLVSWLRLDDPSQPPIALGEQLLGSIPFSTSGGFTQILNTATAPAGANLAQMKLQVDDTALSGGQINFASPSLTKPLVDSLWADQLGLSGVWDVLEHIFSGTSGGGGGSLGSVLSSGLLLLDALGGQSGADIPAILQRFLHLDTDGIFDAVGIGNVNGLSPITNDGVVPGLGLLRGVLGGGLNAGAQNDTWALDDLFGLLQRNTQQTIENTAVLNELVTQQIEQDTSGTRAIEKFEYVDTDSMAESLWDVEWLAGSASNARIAVADGHNAGMEYTSGSNIIELARYQGPGHTTETNYQRVAVVVAVPMSGSGSETHLYMRESPDRSKWVRWNFGVNGQVKLEYKNGGAITQIGSTMTGVGVPPVGTIMAAVAGTDGGENAFEAFIGTRRVHTVTDVSNVHAKGAGQRESGWGQKRGTSGLPGKVTQFTTGDNVPVAVVGSTIRVFRAVTTGITKGGGSGPVPANTFDTIDYISSDITWNALTSTAVFKTPGTYLFSGRFEMSNAIGFSEELYPTIVVNGVDRIRGGARRGISIAAFGVPHFPQDRSAGGDAMLLYLQANTSVQFGFFATQSNTVIGDPAGGKTWFSGVRIG